MKRTVSFFECCMPASFSELFLRELDEVQWRKIHGYCQERYFAALSNFFKKFGGELKKKKYDSETYSFEWTRPRGSKLFNIGLDNSRVLRRDIRYFLFIDNNGCEKMFYIDEGSGRIKRVNNLPVYVAEYWQSKLGFFANVTCLGIVWPKKQ